MTVRKAARSDDGNAFIPDPGEGPAHARDTLAEVLAEQFLTSATSAEESAQDAFDEVVPEEEGGPFLETDAGQEMAPGTDRSNPVGAKREALPTPMRAGKS